jgi:hypothetical protein
MRVLGALVADRTEQKLLEPPEPARADHEELRIARRLQEHLHGRAFRHPRVQLDSLHLLIESGDDVVEQCGSGRSDRLEELLVDG